MAWAPAATPWDQLARLDAGSWHSRRFAGEPLPAFENVARFCLANGHLLNVEIKPTPGLEAKTGQVVADHARAHLARRGRAAAAQLVPAQRPRSRPYRCPGLPRAQLLDALTGSWLDDALALGCVAIVTAYPQIDAGSIRRIHDAGLKALVYTVNDPAEARRLAGLGIDGIITDAVDRFSPGDGVAD